MANLTIVVDDGTLKKTRMRALEEDTWRWTALIYGEKFEEALTYAARLHRTQMRKGTNVPYVTHLLAVAAIVGENGGTEDEVIAALLHDAVEDQGGRKPERRSGGALVIRLRLSWTALLTRT